MAWWQWLLVYPTLVIALLTALPSWYTTFEAARAGLEPDRMEEAWKQNAFWKKNLECMAAPFDWVENPNRVKVDGTICPSGDVMIRLSTPMKGDFIRGLLLEDLIDEAAPREALLGGRAYAASVPTMLPASRPGKHLETDGMRLAQEATVICQRFLEDGRTVVRHVRVETACYDEYVDTYTGHVTSKEQVQCRDSC